MNNDIHKKRLILNNQPLVHFFVQKTLGISQKAENYNDLVSIGTIGLIKAANTFDESKKIKFSSYAIICIRNELYMHFRKSNKYVNDISIYETIANDKDGSELQLDNILKDENSNFVEDLLKKEDIIKIINIIANSLKPNERIVMLYYLANLKQYEIGTKLNISRSYVSRLQQRSIKKIRNILENNIYYIKFFSINISEENYIIDFSIEDINFDYKVFLQKLTDDSYHIRQKENRIIIELPIIPDSYLFIIKLIQVIEEFNV